VNSIELLQDREKFIGGEPPQKQESEMLVEQMFCFANYTTFNFQQNLLN
jgi:hypothetical protein